MDFELIREFQVVALTQNLSKAAKELHITQSCLSKHMTELEAQTGLKLLNHDVKCVTLAPAGKYFAQETSTIIAAMDDCIKCCKKIQTQRSRSFEVAVFLDGNCANGYLFQTGQDFRRIHPEVDVVYSKLIGSTPQEALEGSDYDVTVAIQCGEPTAIVEDFQKLGIEAVPLCTEDWIAWLRNDNRLAKKEVLVMEDFFHVPIMTSATNCFDYMRESTKEVFRKNGMTPFFKPVHFEIESPWSFFLSDFDNTCILFTTAGMCDNQCLSIRDDISYRRIEDDRLKATSYALCLKTNKTAMEFLSSLARRTELAVEAS